MENPVSSDTSARRSRRRGRRPLPRWRRWLGNVARITVISLLVVVVLVWWKALRIQENPSWPPPPDAVTSQQAQAVTTAFLDRDGTSISDLAIPLAPSTVASASFYSDGTEFFPPMFEDMAAAEHSIHILMFTFTPGDIAEEVIEILEDRRAAGVEVRMITDRYGGKVFSRSSELYERLISAGVQVVINDVFPIDHNGLLDEREIDWRQDEVGNVDHRKMLVVDGEIGWVGGAGFEDHFRGGRFHDTYTRVSGDVVRQMQLVYLTSFHVLGGPPPEGDLVPYFPMPDDPGTIGTVLLHNVPVGFVPGTQAIRELIDGAENRLDILNPYLTDQDMVRRVIGAGERGVDIRVVVPGDGNVPPASAALRHRYGDLFGAGVAVYEHEVVLHAKVLVVDDTVLIGTINLDAWALYRNHEIALMFEDASLAEDARQVMVDDALTRSVPAALPDGRWQRVHDWFWNQMVYFL
jgi:cardiolipin synthase A/B